MCKNTKTLTEAFMRFCYFCSSFWRPFLLCISKFGWLQPNLVTVCSFVHEIIIIETLKFNTRCGNIFWIKIRKKFQKFSERFCAIDSFIPLFGNNSLLYPIKLARLPPHSVTVCEFMHEVHILQSQKFNTRCRNVFWIDIRKKIQKFRERFCVNVIFLTSPRRFSTYSY